MTTLNPARELAHTVPPTDSLSIRGWLTGIPTAWRRPSWRRYAALWAVAGVVGDAVTTSLYPLVDEVHEANPVAAAGQSLIGSVPLFMVLVSVPLLALMLPLASKPRTAAERVLWAAIAVSGAIKLAVTFTNITVLHAALWNATITVV